MNYKKWIRDKLDGTTGPRAALRFGGVYVFDVREDTPPLLIVTRAFSRAIYGIDITRIPRRLRPEILKEYEKIMEERSELKRNGRLFELERQLSRYKVSKTAVRRFSVRDIASRVSEVDLDDLRDLVRRAI